jgi:hypothetical protein
VAATRGLSLLACVVLLPAAGLQAQEAVEGDTARVDSTPAPTETDPAVVQPASEAAVQGEGSPVGPMGAFFRSLILPGWGQAAVDQPARGAFYFTMEAGSLWMLAKTQAKLDAAKRAGDEELAASRQEQKEDWIVLAVFWALFAGVDAWVSAHLWDFEGAVVPPPDGSPGVAVQYSIPVDLP